MTQREWGYAIGGWFFAAERARWSFSQSGLLLTFRDRSFTLVVGLVVLRFEMSWDADIPEDGPE